MKFIVAEKEGPHGMLLIVTDQDILGKYFSDAKAQLDLSKGFYKGSEKSKTEVREMIHTVRHLHLTGKEAVALGIEMDLVEPKHVLWVQGIPHAEVVMGE